jgi:squalene-hopene/tetraprenyl-beta-curcumene cyclase
MLRPLLLGALLGLTALTAVMTVRAEPSPGATAAANADAWDAAAAARYLDARMDLWWAKAKPLRTGASETKCLSCHTAVPYFLARPVLRRLTGTPAPTAHEDRVLDTVRKRVAHVNDQAPFYDHTDAKKVESRGVEAVFNALILTRADTLGRSSQPSAPTRAAMARLWEVQRADGSWDWLDFGLEPYETTDARYYGAALAAMAAGSRPGAGASTDATGLSGLTRLRAYLRDGLPAQHRFNKAWALLASVGFDGIVSAEQREALLREFDGAQRADGGWSLADLGGWRWSKSSAPYAAAGKTDPALLDASDAYATGLVIYAMRQTGRPSTVPSVSRGLTWLREHQVAERADDPSWAPWRAHSLNFDREHGGDKGEPWRRMFMSDLATAFAVLALAN